MTICSRFALSLSLALAASTCLTAPALAQEPLFKRALAIREKSLSAGRPDLGQSLNNLATFYEKQDRHADSEPLFKRALAIYEKAAGPEHPAVATLLNNIGQVDKVQGVMLKPSR
jgi:tetratricopeptide (TPR) repeat protein